MIKNIKLVIAYDGTHFLGWQKTQMGPSIEEILEKILHLILQEKVSLQAASRTDAGVHARGQVVNFLTSKAIDDLGKFQASLNSLLPDAISVMKVEIMPIIFHPTLDCIEKEYCFTLCLAPIPLPWQRHYSWHCPYPLNINAMKEASIHFLGKHDFSAFCNAKLSSQNKDFIREIKEIKFANKEDHLLDICISGPKFLFRMVRNIIGTILYVGRGKILPSEIPEIILQRNRTLAGPTAPAHGLTLIKVLYL